MANEVKWKAPTSRTSGISAASLNAGANLLGSEINNETNLDRYLNLELTWTCSTASVLNEVVEVYLLYAIDGTNYEDGGVSVDPIKVQISFFSDNGLTTAQKQAKVSIPIPPFKFKILIKSELTNNATSVTVDAETYNEDIQ